MKQALGLFDKPRPFITPSIVEEARELVLGFYPYLCLSSLAPTKCILDRMAGTAFIMQTRTLALKLISAECRRSARSAGQADDVSY